MINAIIIMLSCLIKSVTYFATSNLRARSSNTPVRQYYNTTIRQNTMIHHRLRFHSCFINGASLSPILQYDNTTILQYANINTIILLYYLSPVKDYSNTTILQYSITPMCVALQSEISLLQYYNTIILQDSYSIITKRHKWSFPFSNTQVRQYNNTTI